MPNQALSVDLREDATEVLIRLEAEGLPTFFEWFEQWFDWLKQLAVQWYEALLRARLRVELGEPYSRNNVLETKACRRCGSRRALRKGWRQRSIEVPRLGRCDVKRPYVECRDCGRSWAIFDEEIGLMPRRRYQPASMMRSVGGLMYLSYAAACRLYPESPSPMTLWRFVQRYQPPLRKAAPEDGTCVLDATYIPGDGPEGQIAVGVAHLVDRGPIHYDRPTLRRYAVAAVAGSEEKLRDALQDQQVDTLVHDGRLDMRGVAQRPARCRWHIPYSVEHTLRHDGIYGATCKAMAAELWRLVFTTKQPKEYAVRIFSWMKAHKLKPESATWGHLRKAVPELQQSVHEPDAFTVVTTSPVEREMREINRRMENGSRWSIPGAESFLKHLQVHRHEPKRYANWLQGLKRNGAQ